MTALEGAMSTRPRDKAMPATRLEPSERYTNQEGEGAEEKPDTFQPKGIFDFLELPAELRNKIYSNLFAEDPTTGVRNNITDHENNEPNMATFKPPAITRASRQLRQVSLAFFFSETHFNLPIITNIHKKPFTQSQQEATHVLDGGETEADLSPGNPLDFEEDVVSSFLQFAGPSAIFKNITIHVQVKIPRYPWLYESTHTCFLDSITIAKINLTVEDDFKIRG